MRAKLSCILLCVPIAATQAQTAPLSFDSAAYVTCREAHSMTPERRTALAVFLADHAARRRGVVLPDNELGAHIGYLVRGGCTLAPDAYLLTVIDRAIASQQASLPKRP